ncbi:LysR family transcriptional regulator [Alicycliphilus sp. B1]|nr:LysR family transcriptional regulator [Alicycliphilus sp. B1]
MRLTPAGQAFLETRQQMAQGLAHSHEELRAIAGRQARTVTLATGRTLARTVVADWLARIQPVLEGGELRVRTCALAESVAMIERGEAGLHPGLPPHLARRAPGRRRQFTHLALATDRLVPVVRAPRRRRTAAPLWRHGRGALPRLLAHRWRSAGWWRITWRTNPLAPRLARVVECDSADAQHEYVLRGLGVAWLPWSHGARRLPVRPAGPCGRRAAWRCASTCACTGPSARLSPWAEALWGTLARK